MTEVKRVFVDEIDHSKAPYVKTNYYCPACGKKHIWVHDDEGDYYLGPEHNCVVCGFWFYMPSEGIAKDKKFTDALCKAIIKVCFVYSCH